MTTDDPGLENLLLLHGEIFVMENGFWVKIEAWRVAASREIPHGLRYSLTLHDRHNTRILGYDNAHAIKPKRKRYGARKLAWDHKHNRETVTPYEFDSADKLLLDFWHEVDKLFNEARP